MTQQSNGKIVPRMVGIRRFDKSEKLNDHMSGRGECTDLF